MTTKRSRSPGRADQRERSRTTHAPTDHTLAGRDGPFQDLDVEARLLMLPDRFVKLRNDHGVRCDFPLEQRLLDLFIDYRASATTPAGRSEAAVDRELDELASAAKALRAALVNLSLRAHRRLSSTLSGITIQSYAPPILGAVRSDLTTIIGAVNVERRSRASRPRDGGGRAPDAASKDLYVGLVRVFQDATGKTAGVGKQGGPEYKGPCFRFARDCLALVEVNPSNSALGKSLLEAIQSLKRIPAPTPAPPRPAELGADLARSALQTSKSKRKTR